VFGHVLIFVLLLLLREKGTIDWIGEKKRRKKKKK
jgi:hypothetical protein